MADTFSDDKVLNYWKRLKSRLQPGRTEVLRTAYENVLYWLGFQWVEWDVQFKGFRRTNTAARVPRPVTNLYMPKLGRVIAMLGAIEPALGFNPGTDSDEDRITANAGKAVINYLERIVNIDALRLELSYTVAICNNAWTLVDFDPEGGAVKRIPKWVCQKGHVFSADKVIASQMKCPQDGTQMLPSPSEYDDEAEGQVMADVVTAFELWVDYTLSMQDQPAIFRRRMRPLEWLYERYPNAEKRNPMETIAADLGMSYKQNIIRLAPALGGFLGGTRFSNQTLIDDLYVKPCKEFPDGMLARIVAEEEVLEAKPLPFMEGTEENPGRRFIPCKHFGYAFIPGSPMLCTGPADFLKSPQRERNRLQSHMMLYSSRSANGVWWLPEGIDVAQITGIEGTVLRGNTTATGGGEPKRIEGGRLPTFFQTRLAEIEDEMNKIVAIEDLHEQAPRVDNARAIALLQQERQMGLNPVYRRFGNSYRQFGTDLFYVFRSFAPEEFYYNVQGEQKQWSTAKLRSADLVGGVDIFVENGSIEPKTQLQKQANREEGMQLGLIDITDPSTRLKVSRDMGLGELMSDLEVDEEHIVREQEATKEWALQNFDPRTGAPKPGIDPKTLANFPIQIDAELDIHPLHLARHRIWMLSEDFQALPEAVQQMFRTMHYNAHRMAMMQEQAAQQVVDQAAQTQQPGRPQGGPAAAPQGAPAQKPGGG